MQSKEEQEYQSFEEDVATLVKALKDSFESDEAHAKIDDLNNCLYVYLEGLHDYEDDEIEEIASPLLEELDLDFEHIYLLPTEDR